MTKASRYIATLALLILPAIACGQIYRVADMNTVQIAALDRARTVVILTGGILEQHGNLLPSGTDTLMNEWWTQSLAEAIVRRPGWKVLLFPTIPLGTSPANVLGARYVFPGSYSVRPETERAIYMDLASDIGQQGFRWVFVVHNHGSPLHNLMLDQAGDYFRDSYGGVMVNLPGLLLQSHEPETPRSAAAAAEEGSFEVHAGMSETSRILFLRTDLVSPDYTSAAPNAANSPADAVRIATRPGWQGYIGSPRLASADYGAQEIRRRANEYNRAALAILDGADSSKMPRLSVMAFKNPAIKQIEDGTQQHYDGIARKQAAWLKQRQDR